MPRAKAVPLTTEEGSTGKEGNTVQLTCCFNSGSVTILMTVGTAPLEETLRSSYFMYTVPSCSIYTSNSGLLDLALDDSDRF